MGETLQGPADELLRRSVLLLNQNKTSKQTKWGNQPTKNQDQTKPGHFGWRMSGSGCWTVRGGSLLCRALKPLKLTVCGFSRVYISLNLLLLTPDHQPDVFQLYNCIICHQLPCTNIQVASVSRKNLAMLRENVLKAHLIFVTGTTTTIFRLVSKNPDLTLFCRKISCVAIYAFLFVSVFS